VECVSPLPREEHEGSGMRPIACRYSFRAVLCPERSCERVDLFALWRVASSGVISGAAVWRMRLGGVLRIASWTALV